MSSLTSPGLIKATNDALIKSAPALNAVKLFAYDFSGQAGDWGQIIKVAVVSHGTISAFNLTSNDYETVDGGITYAPVALSVQPKSTFEFTGNDILDAPNAPYWNKCADSAADGVRGFISEKFGELLVSGNGVSTISALNTVTKSNLAKLRKECPAKPASTVLLCQPDVYADILALFDSSVLGTDGGNAVETGILPRLYGYKAILQVEDMDNAYKAALVDEGAIAFASRAVKVGDEGAYSEFGTVADEYGFPLTVMRHGAPRTGCGYINVTTLFGAAIIQPSMIKLIV